jgi:hypothetical protein
VFRSTLGWPALANGSSKLTCPVTDRQNPQMRHWTDELEFLAPRSRSLLRPKEETSPYFDVNEDDWVEVTRGLLRAHPLSGDEIAAAVLDSWSAIFESTIGPGRIGTDIFPTPQVMGFLLHELIPLQISRSDSAWRRDTSAAEKDLVYLPDSTYSTEIKTSSHGNQIFGNRSYGVERAAPSKKAKSGYYCTVNFEKWSDARSRQPEIGIVRFGWIDSTDWRAQTAETGQNSTLPGIVYQTQLPVVYQRP